MKDFIWLAAALFLPLFPFSAVFVLLLKKISNAGLRSFVLLIWPQLGLYILTRYSVDYPDWLLSWAIITSLLYALRILVVRELGVWLAFIAVSIWPVLWLVAAGEGKNNLLLYGLGFSLPLALMSLLGGELKQRYQSSYAGLTGGLAQAQPRLAGLFVITMLAVTATPVFPGFFTMVSSIVTQFASAPFFAAGLLLAWLLWSWSGMRLLQGVVMGVSKNITAEITDLNITRMAIYVALIFATALLGIYMAGEFL